MKCLTKIENNENDYYEDDNFYFQKYDILNSSDINEIEEEEKEENNKVMSNFPLSLERNFDESNSTSIEKKETEIDKKTLRKLKKKQNNKEIDVNKIIFLFFFK